MVTWSKGWLLIFVGALGAFFCSALGRGPEVMAPSILRQGPDGQVWLLADRSFIELSAQGDVIAIVPDTRFGFSSHVSDFVVLDDGRVLVGDGEKKEVRFFSHDQTLERTVSVPGVGRHFSFDYDEALDKIYVANPGFKQVEARSMTGDGVRTSTSGAFSRPIDIRLQPGGRVLVADFGLGRTVLTSSTAEILSTFHRAPNLMGSSILGVGPGGSVVVVDRCKSRPCGKIAWLRNEGRVDQFEFGSGFEPAGVLVKPDQVLVTDQDSMRIFSWDGGQMSTWGSMGLTEILEELQLRFEISRSFAFIGGYGPMVMLLIALVGAFVVHRESAMAASKAKDLSWAACVSPRLRKVMGQPHRAKIGVQILLSMSFMVLFAGVVLLVPGLVPKSYWWIGCALLMVLFLFMVTMPIRRHLLERMWTPWVMEWFLRHGPGVAKDLLPSETVLGCEVVWFGRHELRTLARFLLVTDQRLLIYGIRNHKIVAEFSRPIAEVASPGGFRVRLLEWFEGRPCFFLQHPEHGVMRLLLHSKEAIVRFRARLEE